MSFRNRPFDRFSHFDPESRLSDFRKRFEQLSQNPNQVLVDSNGGHRWVNAADSQPMSKNAMNGKKCETEEEGIPIKVIHEKSEERAKSESNEEKNCDKNSDKDNTSSLGSTRSHRTSDTSQSSGSNASNASVFSTRSQSTSSQPRVHHIPITVEPRDGSTSSGYTSETTATNEQPLSRSSSHSSDQSFGSRQTRGEKRSPSPAMSVSSQQSNTSNGSKGRVTQIPIKTETNSDLNETNASKDKKQSKTKASQPMSGPFVTRIPVVGQSETETQNESRPESQPKPNASEMICKILSDLKDYEMEVKDFSGMADDKKYRYLDEMLTRIMIRLDTIETNGDEEVRKQRKSAIVAVNKCISLLESKVCDKKPSKPQSVPREPPEPAIATTTQSDQPMDVTPEPSDELKAKEEAMDLSETQSDDNSNEHNIQSEDKDSDCTTTSVTTQSSNGHRKETAV